MVTPNPYTAILTHSGESTVRWVNGVGGDVITGNDVINRYEVTSNGSLTMSGVRRGDSGEYVCVRTITTVKGSYETSVKWFIDVTCEYKPCF